MKKRGSDTLKERKRTKERERERKNYSKANHSNCAGNGKTEKGRKAWRASATATQVL